MKLFTHIDKVLAAFGNIKAMERTHVDTFTENLIDKVEGVKLAASEYGQIWYTIQEIAGYTFLNTSIISATNIKTIKGSKLVFLTRNEEHTLKSDTLEIESEYSNVSNRYLTKVDFIIDTQSEGLIKNKTFDTVDFYFKKKIIPFNCYQNP